MNDEAGSGPCTHYYRTFPRRVLSRPEWQMLTLEERGALSTIRLLAGLTNSPMGTLALNGKLLRAGSLATWLSESVRGCGPAGAARIVATLLERGYLTARVGGAIFVSDWMDDQVEAPTPEAKRQRACRARKRAGRRGDEDSQPPAAQEGSDPSPPSPPPSSFEGETSRGERDASRTGAVTRHAYRNSISKSERVYPSNSKGSGGGEGGDGSDIYDPRLDPVQLAIDMVGVGGEFNRNTYSKGLRDIGEAEFRTCLSELRQALLRTGSMRVVNPAGFFTGCLAKHGAFRDGDHGEASPPMRIIRPPDTRRAAP